VRNRGYRKEEKGRDVVQDHGPYHEGRLIKVTSGVFRRKINENGVENEEKKKIHRENQKTGLVLRREGLFIGRDSTSNYFG